MKAIIIEQELYDQLISKIEAIQTSLENKQMKLKDNFLDNQEFTQLLNISKRTAQSWRDEGKISFSQIGFKIYYRMSDVQKLLDSNYRKAFIVKKRNY